MFFGKVAVWTGLIAFALAGSGAQTPQQDSKTATGSAPAGQQQNVPDAPRPQPLPRLNTITPVGPALPEAPAPSTSNTGNTDDDADAPSSLPSTPKPAAQEDQDQGPPPEMGANTFHLGQIRVNFVEVPFTVKDRKGQLVPGLTPRDVRVYENGLRQHISFFAADPFPLSVAVIIDQSVTFDTMTKINNALSALQNAFSPYDEVAIFTYNNGVRKQTDFTAAQSARLGVILERSKTRGREPNLAMGSGLDQTLIKNNQIVDPNTTPVRNQTSIYQTPEKEYHTLNDAILAAAIETGKAAKGRRRVVYVISDGREYGSKASQKEVIRYLQTNEITVYATLVGDSAIPGMGFLDRIHLPLTMRDDVLPRYAAVTGGQCDPEFRQKGIEESFARITEQVRAQYTVGYYTREPMLDGKFRRTEVRVMRPNLNIIAKEGYYPTPRGAGQAPAAAAAATPVAVP